MKQLYILVGLLSLCFGIIGAFVPLLPTTPFLLLSASLFARSSNSLHNWLINQKYFGQIIKDYNQFKVIPLRAKIISISLILLSFGYSIIFLLNPIWLKALMGTLGILVIIFILSHKSIK